MICIYMHRPSISWAKVSGATHLVGERGFAFVVRSWGLAWDAIADSCDGLSVSAESMSMAIMCEGVPFALASASTFFVIL